MTRKTVELSI